MDKDTVRQWLDQNEIQMVRTHATNLDGLAVSKYLNREKFLKSIPDGHSIGDMALAMDFQGSPHLTFWHEFRNSQVGDIHMKPMLETLSPDARDTTLAHCLCEFTGVHGEEIELCPRTLLRQVTAILAEDGFHAKAAFELEFFVYKNSFSSARRSGYKNLNPIGASMNPNIYLARNAYHGKPFMDEVVKRLDALDIDWESWSDEGGPGQLELNFTPQSPLVAADNIVRARQVIYEVAVDMGCSATFMPHMGPGYASGLHIHHSITDDNDKPLFADDSGRTGLLHHWIAGILASMPGAVSFLCPTINSYRRMTEFTAPPVTATWGEENKSAGLRTITRTPSLARIEHRLASSDANPYLALAIILAGGLAGHRQQLNPPAELMTIGWGLPDEVERLPNTLMSAAKALEKDTLIASILGQQVVDYWVNSRKLEWLTFHTGENDPDSKDVSKWEFERYFELI